MASFECVYCGNTIHPYGKESSCRNCGAIYETQAMPHPDIWENLKWASIGGIISLVFVAPFIWTPVGRELAIKAAAKGAKRVEKEIREWVEAGERE